MTVLKPWILQPKTGDTVADYTSTDYRQLLSGIWNSEGVLSYTSGVVSPRAEGANLSVDVSSTLCVVQCDTATPAGKYFCPSTAKVNVSLPAAPASGSRTHFIVAQVHDGQNDGGTDYSWAPEVAADTGSGAVVPPSALKLAEVTVNHGQSQVTATSIVDSRKFALTLGTELWQDSGRGVIAGTFTPGKITRRLSGHDELNLGSDGKFTITGPPGATAILDVSVTPQYHSGTSQDMAHGWHPENLGGGTTTLSNLVMQARYNDTTVVVSRWIAYSYTIQYQ